MKENLKTANEILINYLQDKSISDIETIIRIIRDTYSCKTISQNDIEETVSKYNSLLNISQELPIPLF
ncbi:MAG: hypothetical protein WDA29_10920 [Flavobacteriaceae bacterium]